MSQSQRRKTLGVPTNLSRAECISLNDLGTVSASSCAPRQDMPTSGMLEVPNLPTARRNTTSSISIPSNIAMSIVPTTDYVEWLYQVTDVVLVFCGIVVIISFFATIGISILGISRIHKGLDYYTKNDFD